MAFSAAFDPAKDITLYAVWERKYSVVTLDANGGKIYDNDTNQFVDTYSLKYEEGKTAYASQYIPDLEGKTFGGWYKDRACTDPVKTSYGNSDLIVSGDVTVYAKWLNEYKVTFDYGDGKIDSASSSNVSIAEGSTLRKSGYTELINPTPNDINKAFVGWFLDESFENKVERNDIMDMVITNNVTFYAKYANAYTITFNANGGSFASASATDTYSVKIAEGESLKGKYPTVRSTDNKVFRGWFTDPEGNDEVVDIYSFKVTGNITLYAGYTECYILTFKANMAGAKLDGQTNDVKVKVTKGIAYRHGNESADKDKLFSAPVLDYSGITVDDKLPVFYYNGSNNVPAWSTNEEGTGRLYYFDTGHHMYTEVNAKGVTERFIYNMYGFVPTGDMTFYAKWADVVYVTFDANGGTFKENTSYDRFGTLSADKTQRVQKVAKGIDANDIAKPYLSSINTPQDDDNQLSWYKDKSGKEYFNGIVTKDITVYAKYTKSSSGGSGSGSGTSPKLTLHSMEGYFDTISQKTHEMRYTVSSTYAYNNSQIPIIDDEDKAFSGWYYDEERKNPYPAKYQIYRNGNWYIVVPKAVSDLYAGYGQTYTVTLNANGGYFDHDSDRVRDPMEDMREEAVLSEKASPAGYGIKISEYTKRIRRDGNKIFAGWYYDKEGTQKAVCTATDSSYEYYKPTENTTLFAKWIDYELPTKVEVGATALTLNIGEKKQLSATVLPESAATSQDVHWYVNSTGSNSKENPYYIPPVILDTDGSVTGQAAGTAYVYAEVDGVRSDNVKITVSAKSVGQSISLNTTAINMVKNETATVTATVVPDTQANTVTWSSSKTSVATVTGNGATAVITAGSEAGEATITASFGKLKASVKVTVSVPITLDKNELVLTSREGVVAKLKATLAGDGVEGKPVTWESSDPEAVAVVPDPQDGSIGILTPAANLDETTTVTVTASVTKDAEHVYRDACVVTVNPVAGVEAPTASIAPGTVKAGTKVQLSSATYQADIYYTTDGSAPTEESALYTDAIVVSENVTIKAVAFKAGLRPSIVKEFAYVVETSDWGELSETAKTLFADSSKVPTGIWYCIKGYGADPNMCRMFTESGKTDHTETYTGNAITFGDSIEVYFGTQKLVENRDYTLKFANNKVVAKADAGKKAPSVTITGKGNYAKKAVFNFTIVQADIADAVVISDPTTLITAGPKAKLTNVKPTFAFNGKKLALNKDYTLAYKNKDTGMVEDPAAETIDKDEVFYVYAVAKENSNFKGEMRSINSAVVIGTDAGDISAKKLKAVNEKGKAISIPYGEIESFIDLLTIFDNRGEGATPKAFIRDGKKDLVYGRDYQIDPVEDDDYKSAGTHSFRIICNRVLTPEEKEAGEKRYLGQKVFSFTIAGNAMKSAKIAGLSTKVEFTGKAIELSDLFNDKDKTVVNYNKTAADDEKWTGVTLYLFDRKSGKYTVLKEDTDYVVSMKNNGNPGKFTLTFTGIGGWTGAISKTVTVKAYDMKKDVRGVIDVSTKTPSFVKTGAKPAVTVKYVTERNEDGSIKTARLLREGVDYTVTYKNNTKIVPNETELNKLKASARPTVTVKGKGNYAGANATATFCITKAPVTNLDVVAKDVIYNEKGKNGYFLVKPQLCDDGKAVSAGKGKDVEAIAKDAYTYIYDEDATMADGSIKYAGSAVAATDKPVDGAVIRVSLTVKCSDKSAYTADANGTEISGVYRVIGAGRDVSKYTVKVINPEVLTYTGGDEIIPIKDTDLEVSYKVKGEKNPIKLRPSDYEIVSIKNNRFIGKATITIAGKGIYGGTKTISAKVGARILK